MYEPSNWATPQIYVDAANAAAVAIPGGFGSYVVDPQWNGGLVNGPGGQGFGDAGPDLTNEDLAAFLASVQNDITLPGTGQMQVGNLVAQSQAAGGYLNLNADGTYSVKQSSGVPGWLWAVVGVGAAFVFLGGARR